MGRLFLASASVFIAFTPGFFTRVVHVLNWLCLLVLQERSELLCNGGDLVLGQLLLWTSLLPLGSVCSLGALRRPKPGPQARFTVSSLAVLGAHAHPAAVYFFGALNKAGSTWRDGSALHYALWQTRTVTDAGVRLRSHAPTGGLRALTTLTLATEYALPLLILVPWGRPLHASSTQPLRSTNPAARNHGPCRPYSCTIVQKCVGLERHVVVAAIDEHHGRVAYAINPRREPRGIVVFTWSRGSAARMVASFMPTPMKGSALRLIST